MKRILQALGVLIVAGLLWVGFGLLGWFLPCVSMMVFGPFVAIQVLLRDEK